MSTELTIKQQFSPDQIDLITRTIFKGATRDELQLFIAQCNRTGLDPITRQIYGIKYGGKGGRASRIDGFRLIAHSRSGEYEGQGWVPGGAARTASGSMFGLKRSRRQRQSQRHCEKDSRNLCSR